MCGVGFGLGMERLLLTAELANAPIPEKERLEVYIAAMGKDADMYAVKLANLLRKAGVSSDTDHVGRSFKAQFKFAGKQKARFVAIVGDDELASGSIKLKDMDKSEEYTVPLEAAVETIKSKVEEGR